MVTVLSLWEKEHILKLKREHYAKSVVMSLADPGSDAWLG